MPVDSPSTSVSKPRRSLRFVIGIFVVAVIAAGFVAADWYVVVPRETEPTFVGTQSCIECHQAQQTSWHNSHHDRAMDVANDETVLANFDDARFEHFGIQSRMFRDGSKFMIHTEGPDGKMADFEIKYVFGCDPIQQYMVEFDRTEGMTDREVARLQVLRISWDTKQAKWFYIPPPDVADKLQPSDPLHWTKAGQNWNHMCADCHSTNLRKHYEIATKTYHTTFSEIDVGCESCHGPGSIHVQLAKGTSLFWDRNFGYGLKKIKGQNNRIEVESCAPCHSRRRVVHPESGFSTDYYNSYSNELLRQETYHVDGQIKDEVYVYGSFLQSKMFHKGIRCTDCHDPHSLKLKHKGNDLCTSCHQHTPAKYDAVGHHHHPLGTTGTSCVECHMPETPYMEIDLRRDHSLRIPRPDLSLKHETPNACTGCHLDKKNIDESKRTSLQYYVDWLNARDTDKQIDAEIRRVDQWADEWIKKWYKESRPEHFADALAAGWKNEPNSDQLLTELATSRLQPGIVRASALLQLSQNPGSNATAAAAKGVRDRDPQVRIASIGVFEWNASQQRNSLLLEYVQPLLNDKSRAVRVAAARVLASVPYASFKDEFKEPLKAGVAELREGLLADADQAGSHMSLALLDESLARAADNRDDQLGWLRSAIKNYSNAIHVQPDVTGPRTNLAQILEQIGDDNDQIDRLRAEELKLFARDIELVPEIAAVHYRYASALQTQGQTEKAIEHYQIAAKLEPDVGQYQYAHAIVLHHQGKIDEAVTAARRACQMEPLNTDFRYALALYLVDAEKFDEAAAILESLMKVMPQDQALMQLYLRIRASGS